MISIHGVMTVQIRYQRSADNIAFSTTGHSRVGPNECHEHHLIRIEYRQCIFLDTADVKCYARVPINVMFISDRLRDNLKIQTTE